MTYAKKKWLVLAGWIAVGLVWPAIGFVSAGSSPIAKDIFVALGCMAIVAMYLGTLVVLYPHLKDIATNAGLVATAYVLSALCLIIIFSSYINYFNLYIPGNVPGYQPMLHEDIFDPIYMSATNFTTLGIGDVYPQGFGGKFLVTAESLLGATHAVVFVALLLIRLSKEIENA